MVQTGAEAAEERLRAAQQEVEALRYQKEQLTNDIRGAKQDLAELETKTLQARATTASSVGEANGLVHAANKQVVSITTVSFVFLIIRQH